MRTHDYVYEHKPLPKDFLIALIYNVCYIKLLDTQRKPYQELAEWFIKNEPNFLDDDKPMPSIKNIADEFATDYKKITKWIKDIYADIIELNQKQEDKFICNGQFLCEITFNYLGAKTRFNLGLNVLPRKGDHFEFDFISPVIGGRGFNVKSIYHFVENGKHKISIILSDEEVLLYYQLKKERALLLGMISHAEFLGLKTNSGKNRITNLDLNL